MPVATNEGIVRSITVAFFTGLGNTQLVDEPLRAGWLNAITADLSVAQVAQGQGLLGTGAVPELLQTGPRKNTRFFFILTSRL